LLIDGFEAWLNESTWNLSDKDGSDNILELGDKGIIEKYYEAPRLTIGTDIPPQPHLVLAVDIRNEIAHFLPRIIEEEGPIPSRQVPPWLKELYEEQLFFVPSSTMENTELTLNILLSSYRLAYWAWETVAEAANAFCDALSGTHSGLLK
jgi:hypothetical protein